MSHDGFKYYVIFVDHHTKYVWLYQLKRKFDTKDTSIRYKSLVEKYFQLPLKILYTDNGSEYESLKNYLSIDGITHLITLPQTPKHYGYFERRHRHIVDTFLTLLHHANMPLQYWTHACSTAVYLINRLPTATLQNASPYLKLFGTAPNYTRLRSFGCLCFPWLKPYTHHKLESKSKPCVFIGYSPTQHVYHYLEIDSHRIYTSRHVHFMEDAFPFKDEQLNSFPLGSNVNTWALLTLINLHHTSPPPTDTSPSNPHNNLTPMNPPQFCKTLKLSSHLIPCQQD